MDLLNGRRLQLETDIDFYDDIRAVQLYGIYPFSSEKVLNMLKADGKKIVYDIDDAVEFIEPTNPFFYAVKKDVSSSAQIFQYADHVTVANEALKKYAEARTRAPVTVVPNCFVQKEWSFVRPKREGFRIGFAGSCTHVADLLEVIPAIKYLQSKYDNVKFIIFGFAPGTYEAWLKSFIYNSPEEGVVMVNKLNEALKEIQFEWVPFVDFDIYPQVLTNISLDIGICPLLPTRFNGYRSSSKAMEYTLSGALAVSSDIVPYNTEPTSLVVTDWQKALEHLLNNPYEIEKLRETALQWIRDNRSIEGQLETLNKVYGV